jgi:superfamily II DNA or RNA helicase
MESLKAAGYQLVPLTKLLSNGQNAILISDGVGVGKTIAAGYIITYLTGDGTPALVVCPPGLQEKWRLELRSKFAISAIPISQAEDLETAAEAWHKPSPVPRVFILPSSLLSRLTPPGFPGPVVIDEIHNYRNPDTALWNSARALTRTAAYRIGLTATPINNRLADLSAQLAILLRIEFEQADAIIADLWRPEHRSLLYPLLTRFSKERLRIHFARRIITTLRVEFPDEYVAQALAAIKRARSRPQNDSVYLDEITYFRLAASSPAALARSLDVRLPMPDTKTKALQGILAQHQCQHVLIFCEFEATAEELARAASGRPSFTVTGSVPVFEREAIIHRFRETKDGVLIMTSVGSEGLDLQFCSVLVNYDLTWNPMVMEQRIGRIDRIGQLKDTIMVYNICVAASIDERILDVVGEKLGLVAGSVLEPQPIIANHTPRPSLVNPNALANEIERARSLAATMALSGELIPNDYRMLPFIDEAYCDPERLQSALQHGRVPWFRRAEAAQEWLTGLAADSSHLRSRISYYS